MIIRRTRQFFHLAAGSAVAFAPVVVGVGATTHVLADCDETASDGTAALNCQPRTPSVDSDVASCAGYAAGQDPIARQEFADINCGSQF